jgi:3-oxoadipate enol-lactonase
MDSAKFEQATIGGRRYAYARAGDRAAPTVLLLHPLALDNRAWRDVAGVLGDRFDVVMPDLMGHGAVAQDGPLVDLASAAEGLVPLLDHLRIEQCHLAGTSMGGAVAQHFAIRHTGRVASLTLLATLMQGLPALADRAEAAERQGMAAQVKPTLERWFRADDLARNTNAVQYARAMLETARIENWASAWRAMAAHQAKEGLARTSIRTLCVYGSADVSAPRALLEEIANHVPHGTLVEIRDAPHMMTLTNPHEVAAAIGAHCTT